MSSAESLGNEKIFKSPQTKFGPLKPLQNMGKGLRGSFLSRGDDSLDKIAQFNKVKDDRVGSGAKGRNFVFAALSPPKASGDTVTSPVEKERKSNVLEFWMKTIREQSSICYRKNLLIENELLS